VNADITRDNPTCFLFLIDQSHSMAQLFGDRTPGAVRTKAEGVADALNDLLRNLIITCSKADGVRNYFDVGVIGYGRSVGPAWSGPLAGQFLVPIREVADRFARLSGALDNAPIWVEPVAGGATPMCEALALCHSLLYGFIARNPYCFPPVVVHITDGEATDGNPAKALAAMTELGSHNGPVMLFNVHLSSSREVRPTSFPDTAEGLADPFARLLFERASRLSLFMQAVAWNHGLTLSREARAFVLNADPSMMVLALEIGTRPGNIL
jgi:hypothetical protein